MAKKTIGIYSVLESTPNYKVEDLYLIVDSNNIVFSVKNKKTNQYSAFEHFANNGENTGWHQLVAYLQNNSKLIQGIFDNIYFVWNSPRFVLTKKLVKEDTLLYQQELNLVHGASNEEELYLTPFDEQFMLVFSVPDALSTLLSRSFPTGKWHHYTAFVLATAAENQVLVHLFENNYCIRIVKEGKTQLINYYPIEGNDQNCFNILNACTNSNIDTNLSTIKVWGYSNLQHEFINTIAPYFKAGEIMEAPGTGVTASLNSNYPQHIYSTYFIF
jgi:hypothetical protein